MFGTPAPAAPAPVGVITHNTKWEELQVEQQNVLTEIQRSITREREACEKLDRNARLQNLSSAKKAMHEETTSFFDKLKSLQSTMTSEEESLSDFKEKVLVLLRSAETTVKLYQRNKIYRESHQLAGIQPSPALQELLALPVVLPSQFLIEAVAGFGELLARYMKCMQELQQVLARHDPTAAAGADALHTLPTILSNLHDYFVYVTAKVERTHTEVTALQNQVGLRPPLGRTSHPGEASHIDLGPWRRTPSSHDRTGAPRSPLKPMPHALPAVQSGVPTTPPTTPLQQTFPSSFSGIGSAFTPSVIPSLSPATPGTGFGQSPWSSTAGGALARTKSQASRSKRNK